MSLCADGLLVRSSIQTCIPDGHLHTVTYTRCHIDTISFPDDGHVAVRNMKRIEINIRGKELCIKLVIYKHYNYPNSVRTQVYFNCPSHVSYTFRSSIARHQACQFNNHLKEDTVK